MHGTNDHIETSNIRYSIKTFTSDREKCRSSLTKIHEMCETVLSISCTLKKRITQNQSSIYDRR
jgi:hypothetical protein